MFVFEHGQLPCEDEKIVPDENESATPDQPGWRFDRIAGKIS
jgi:hypothetical protein